jgi:uncharacterized protein with HEPN domain
MPSSLSETTRDALDAIRLNIEAIRRFLHGTTVDSFCDDLMKLYATIQALEIISEASRRLPDDLRARHPRIEWRAIRDAGNMYRHAYSRVIPARVWDTARYQIDDLWTVVSAELRDDETP